MPNTLLINKSEVIHCFTLGQVAKWRGQDMTIKKITVNDDETISYTLLAPGDMELEVEEYLLAKENPYSTAIE